MVYRFGHAALRAAIALLATGTVADQMTRSFTTNPFVLSVVWAALLLGLWIFTTRPSVEGTFELVTIGSRATAFTFVSGLVAALCAYLLNQKHNSLSNTFAIVVAVLIVFGGAIAVRLCAVADSFENSSYHHWWKKRDSAVLGACIALVAGMSDLTYRAITDDHYYVNMSTYIYERGVIPAHDTVLSDQVFRGLPRFESWEVLWGTIAHVVHIPPAYILYLFVIPAGAALSVVALAHLIDTAGISRYKEALVAGSVFLTFDGASAFSFGAYQGPRTWEGKSFMLAVVLPLLFSCAIRVLRNPTHRTRTDLVVATIATIGASTTAFIVATPILLAALVLSVRKRTLEPAIAGGIGYLALCGVAFHQISKQTQSSTGGLGAAAHVPLAKYTSDSAIPSTYDVLTKIAHPSWHAALFALCICLGWLALRGKGTRELVGLCVAGFGLISLPGVLPLVLKVTGAAPIAWRFLWLVPIPLMVAATASTIAEAFNGSSRNQRLLSFAAPSVFVALLAILPMTLGTPPWGNARGTKMEASLSRPFALRVGFGYQQASQALSQIAHEGDTVLARNGLSASINALSSKYFTVAVRPAYVRGVTRGFSDGFPAQRIALSHFVTGDEQVTWSGTELADALAAVQVNVVCITSDFKEQVPIFQELGYTDSEKKVHRDKAMWVWCGRTNAYDN